MLPSHLSNSPLTLASQVGKEKTLGYPVTAIYTADDEALGKNEVGFTSYFVAPMWKHLTIIFPHVVDHLVVQMECNLDSWKAMNEKKPTE